MNRFTQRTDSRTRIVVVLIALAVAGGPVVSPALAQSDPTGLTWDGPQAWEQTAKFVSPGGGELGTAVSLDGSTAIVGAPGAPGGGQARILSETSSGWSLDTQRTVPNSSGTHAFGAAVDVDGDLAIVGDTGNPLIYDEMTEGSAYIYEDTGSSWELVASLSPPPDASETNRGFGFSVAIDASTDTAVVGAPLEDTEAGNQSGTAIVYRESSDAWTKEATLTPNDLEADDRFGEDVALDGSIALVGAPREDTAANSAGAAYVFHDDGKDWTQSAKLLGSQAASDLFFGIDVDLEGAQAIVGTYDPAYVFSGLPGDVTEEQRLLTDDRVTEEGLFGRSIFMGSGDVALDEDTAVIGAPTSLAFQPGGKAFVFAQADSGDWSQVTELTKRDPVSAFPDDGWFGHAVAVDDDRALVGAPREDSATSGRNGGAAFVFAPCDETGPVSQPVHEQVEPSAGGAQETVHDVNCDRVRQLES